MRDKALRQAMRFGAEIDVTREVTAIERRPDKKYCFQLDGEDRFVSESIILATGVNWRSLEAAGVKRLLGRGVFYGAAKTETASVIGKGIFIVGGGNSAGQAAVFFASYAKSVTVLVRGAGLEHTKSHYLIRQIALKANIQVETHTQVVAAEGAHQLEWIVTERNDPAMAQGEQGKRRADALFILIGATAHTGWLPKELQRDENGFVHRTGCN